MSGDSEYTVDLYWKDCLPASWSRLGRAHAHVHAQPLETETWRDCARFSKESNNNGADHKSPTGNKTFLNEYPNPQQHVATRDGSFALFLSGHSSRELQAAAAGVKRNEIRLQSRKKDPKERRKCIQPLRLAFSSIAIMF